MKKKRPDELEGRTWKAATGCGSLYVTVNYQDDEVFELFAKLGKTGGCASAQTEALGRLVSHAARTGNDLEGIVRQLKGIRCHEAREGIRSSCADAIAGVLEAALALEGNEEKD